MIEMIDFNGKKWQVVGKCSEERIDDHTKLKKQYGCGPVLFWIKPIEKANASVSKSSFPFDFSVILF